MELVLRVVLSLGAVLLLMWFIARTASRRMSGTHASLVRLLGRQSVGRSASVAVIGVGERVLVVGVTENGVRLLTELDAEEVDVPLPVEATTATTQGTPALEATTTTVVPAGSLLSTQTWKQAWHSATTRSGNAT
jgi:flagellar protein FliO/FliZ